MDTENDWKQALQDLPLTPETVAALLAGQCRHDPEFARQIQEAPRDCLEKLSGHKPAENIQLVIHDNTDDTWHLPLPHYQQDEALSAEQLQEIAAGLVATVVSTTVVATVIGLATLAALGVLSGVGVGTYFAVEASKTD